MSIQLNSKETCNKNVKKNIASAFMPFILYRDSQTLVEVSSFKNKTNLISVLPVNICR